MTELEKQQLNEKIARWCGFIFKGGYWFKPNHPNWEIVSLPNFPNSMDALIKWVTPKLGDWNVASDEEYKFWARVSEFADDKAGYHIYDAFGDSPSEAFCLALEKLIDSIKPVEKKSA